MKKRRSTKRPVIVLLIALLVVGAGGYVYFTQTAQAAQTPAEPALQTAKVRTDRKSVV